MKTVRIHETGGPEVLSYEDAPDPIPGPGEALVEIKAIGVNFTDVASRRGGTPPESFPWTPGREAAGVVTAVGEGVSEVSVGDRVATPCTRGPTPSGMRSLPGCWSDSRTTWSLPRRPPR